MPTLHWIGKEKVTNHHLDIPYHTLDLQYQFGLNQDLGDLKDAKDLNSDNPSNPTNQGSDNLIIHADNLLALKSLLPQYEGRVKCIYIDPPYNTGNEGWVYNDNVSSPRFKKWLGQVVGKEGEDLTRHDKWLCMMYPRLKLLHKLLADDGAIFISIDDNEQASLKMMMDEIFGAGNKLGTLIWKNATDNNPTNVSIEHEFILCFAKNKSSIQSIWKSSNSPAKDVLINVGRDLVAKFKDKGTLQNEYNKWFRENKQFLSPLDRYKYIDEGGIYTGSQSVHNPGKEGYRFDVIHPITGKACKQPLMGYRFPQSTMDELIRNGKILFGDDHEKIIELKLYAHEYKTKLASVISLDGRLGSYELKSIFPDEKRHFDTPKTVQLIEELLSFATKNDDIILDSFAGSGTTAHAVLNLNKQDGGNRRFILI